MSQVQKKENSQEDKRAPNFSKSEEQLLIALIEKYKTIIECKKSNAVTWKDKEKAWLKIESEFNSKNTGDVFRSRKHLKEKYNNLKKETKRKFALEKINTSKTGGGPFVPVKVNDVHLAIKDILGEQVSGLQNTYDCDSENVSMINSDPSENNFTSTSIDCIDILVEDVKETSFPEEEIYNEQGLDMRIELFSENNFYKKTESGENVILKIKVCDLFKNQCLPHYSTLQWFNPNGEEIVESPKYYIKKYYEDYETNETISLQITRLNIMDSGNYTIHAQNPSATESRNFLLDVIGKPISSLTRTKSYYSLNESTEFHCEIISNPPPNITWSFYRYPKYPSFEDTTTVNLTNVTQRAAYNSSYKIESMVVMPIEVSGKIKCEACNILGCDSKNETILVSDGLGTFGIIGPRESVVKGDNIDLICAASVYNYINKFTWTVRVNQTEKPINETERLTVVQHRTLFTYRSTLKLNNVQKSDAQDYFCTGEIMNTSNQESLDSLSNRAIYTLIIHDFNNIKQIAGNDFLLHQCVP